ncbi:hypothetical protein EXS56_01160 [Candidatus Kaiserbacteria bacterium]|nr:hypothetical protein [Candidatus Kaiserbacteria bacterium]
MDGMRAAVLFFVALLFFTPSALFSEEKFDPKAINGSNDKCLNEKIAIIDGKSVLARGRTDTEQYKVCRNISGGCNLKKDQNKECTCGRMVYVTLEKKTLVLNKCDPDIKKKLAKAMAGGIEGMTAFATQEKIAERIREIDTSTADGRDKLSQILQSYGVSQADADAKVNDADKAADVRAQLQKFVGTSDTDEAKKVASELGFKLNEDLTDAVRLDAKKYVAVLTEEELARSQIAVPNTFPRDLVDAVPQVLVRDVLYSGQGGCYAVSNSYGTFRPCVLTQDQIAQVKGNIIPQVASVYWEGNQRADGRAFNANELGVAHQTLPLGTQVLVYNPQTGQAVVATVNDRGPFVSGRDIDLSRGTANAIGFSGVGSVQTVVLGSSMPTGTLGQYASVTDAFQAYQASNGTIAVGDGNIPPGTPRNTSPFGPGNSAYTNTASPFSNLSSAPIAQQAAYTPQPSSSAQPTATPVSQNVTPNVINTQTQGTSTQSAVAKQLQDALQNPDATSVVRQSPATVVAQPKEVTRGNPITVSWTSIGMSTDSPCVLRANSTFIAEGNQGAKVVPTTQATRVGSLIFTLSCTTAAGVTFQRTTAVMVR